MSSDKPTQHTCVLCNKNLETKEALKEHFRKHANKEIDSKGNPSGVKIKMPENNGVYVKGSASKFVKEDLICDDCGEVFKCNTQAIQHKFKKHPNSLAKHFCPECGKQFPLKMHRDLHLASHKIFNHQSPNLLHRCAYCNIDFFNLAAYEYHYNSLHKKLVSIFTPTTTPPPSKKIRFNNAGDPQSVYYCHLCGSEYIVKFNLQKHLEKQHTEEERNACPPEDMLVKCKTCDALFFNERAFTNHNMYHRPDDLYILNEAQRLQTVKRVDQDFDIRRVQTPLEKYIPTSVGGKRGPKVRRNRYLPPKRLKEEDSESELSPPSEGDSSDESDCDNIKNKLRSSRGNSSNSNSSNFLFNTNKVTHNILQH
ncbi:zinc finger protein 567 [Nilaparvata lugens]|uniref:zinc finger protein 567 n=1 Tax=Nilaparvata lugens TaxID=108931 RepID=UPI000B98BA2C|nr:zinc finger protein 567 [Nilaparvata lugens]